MLYWKRMKTYPYPIGLMKGIGKWAYPEQEAMNLIGDVFEICEYTGKVFDTNFKARIEEMKLARKSMRVLEEERSIIKAVC